ncbi:hypothetical protein F2Q69_00059064 [Brassica cretica]|uniref:Uncharacterized protein n=1 Tax=Brassica cretica TaxID=69181 RepID=A0A8S9RP97_BRACR|nr:hypothetical protein F2Q69_00059064 [Brassica cretica]
MKKERTQKVEVASVIERCSEIKSWYDKYDVRRDQGRFNISKLDYARYLGKYSGEQATESSVARTGQSLLGINSEWSQLEATLPSFLGMMITTWNSEFLQTPEDCTRCSEIKSWYDKYNVRIDQGRFNISKLDYARYLGKYSGEQATESSVARTGQSLLGIYSDPEMVSIGTDTTFISRDDDNDMELRGLG